MENHENLDETIEEPDEHHLDRFDDGRILRGKVSQQEISELEASLVETYLQRANVQGAPVIRISDIDKDNQLRESGELFDGSKHYLGV